MLLLKPGDSTTSEYVAGASCGNSNRPFSLLLVESGAFVAVLVAVTLTPGIRAPVGSLTKPEMLPVGDAMTHPVHITNITHRKLPLDRYLVIDRLLRQSGTGGEWQYVPILWSDGDSLEIYSRSQQNVNFSAVAAVIDRRYSGQL